MWRLSRYLTTAAARARPATEDGANSPRDRIRPRVRAEAGHRIGDNVIAADDPRRESVATLVATSTPSNPSNASRKPAILERSDASNRIYAG